MNKCIFGGCNRKDLLHNKQTIMSYACCKDCPEKNCDVRCKDMDRKGRNCKWLLPEVVSINALTQVEVKPTETKKKRRTKEEIAQAELEKRLKKEKPKKNLLSR